MGSGPDPGHTPGSGGLALGARSGDAGGELEARGDAASLLSPATAPAGEVALDREASTPAIAPPADPPPGLGVEVAASPTDAAGAGHAEGLTGGGGEPGTASAVPAPDAHADQPGRPASGAFEELDVDSGLIELDEVDADSGAHRAKGPAGERSIPPPFRASTEHADTGSDAGAGSGLVAPDASADAAGGAAARRHGDAVDALMSGLVDEAKDPTRRTPWWAEVFDEAWIRLLPASFYRRTLREVAFLKSELALDGPKRVLDVACGFGRHAIELAAAGHRIVGVDRSRPLLQRALKELERRNLSAAFLLGDMREMVFDREFDAAFCVHSSFGYFNDEENLAVMAAMARAVEPGGMVAVEQVSRDWVASTTPHRRWWESDDLVVMEDVSFDVRRSVLAVDRSVSDRVNPPREQHIEIRLYSPHELIAMGSLVGLDVRSLTGDIAHPRVYLGAGDRSVCLVAQRRLTD